MSQNAKILRYIRERGSITPQEALNMYGCMRLGARIHELRRQGYDIRSERETARNRFGERVTYARYIWGGGT